MAKARHSATDSDPENLEVHDVFLLHAQCVKAFDPKLIVEPEIKHGTNSSN